MSNLGKRGSPYIVDLDGDENLVPNAKYARVNNGRTPSSQSHGSRSSHGSQPLASQSFSSSQGLPNGIQAARDSWQETNEEYEVIDLSQDVDEGAGWVLIGAISDKVSETRLFSISIMK